MKVETPVLDLGYIFYSDTENEYLDWTPDFICKQFVKLYFQRTPKKASFVFSNKQIRGAHYVFIKKDIHENDSLIWKPNVDITWYGEFDLTEKLEAFLEKHFRFNQVRWTKIWIEMYEHME